MFHVPELLCTLALSAEPVLLGFELSARDSVGLIDVQNAKLKWRSGCNCRFFCAGAISARLFGAPKARIAVSFGMIGIVTAIVLALIAVVAFSNFPGTPEGNAGKATAPAEDVRR
jgi:hypothetical protein